MQVDFVDTFVTGWGFSGNSAAVVQTPSMLSEDLMQHMSIQHGTAETVFVTPLDEQSTWYLRAFSPTRRTHQVRHGVFAAAYVLCRQFGVTAVYFKLEDNTAIRISMTAQGFRLEQPMMTLNRFQPPPVNLLSTFPVGIREVYRGQDWLLVYDDPAKVFAASPERHNLLRLNERGIIITAPGLEDCDYLCRYFAPRDGVYEDAVSPLTHTITAPYWAERLGKSELSAYQASHRGGRLFLQCAEQFVAISGVCRLYASAQVNTAIFNYPHAPINTSS